MILFPGVPCSFLLYDVTFVPWRPECKLIPAAFIFLPTVLCKNYCADYVYMDNGKITFFVVPYNMCFVRKCISSTENIMVKGVVNF